MRARLSCGGLILILVASLLALTPMAYASPPDPSWISGFYDDADFDDVVDYLTSASGLVDIFVTPDLRPVPFLIAPLVKLVEDAVPSVPLAPSRPRAPPSR
jgi:hypothetical protein